MTKHRRHYQPRRIEPCTFDIPKTNPFKHNKPLIHPKLKVGALKDKYEQEAETGQVD